MVTPNTCLYLKSHITGLPTDLTHSCKQLLRADRHQSMAPLLLLVSPLSEYHAPLFRSPHSVPHKHGPEDISSSFMQNPLQAPKPFIPEHQNIHTLYTPYTLYTTKYITRYPSYQLMPNLSKCSLP